MKKIIYTLMLAFFAVNANAAIVWDWSFGSNEGQFVTEGSNAVAGTYLLTDFSVTSSGDGATIGSWVNGDYLANGFSTNDPYSLVWDGSSVTQWISAGGNSFDWLVFEDFLTSSNFLFGWGSGNQNIVDQAAYYPMSLQSSLLSVDVANAVAVVPEPSIIALLGLGLVGVGFARRKRTS